MKNLFIAAGVAMGLVLAPVSFSSAMMKGDRFVTATFHCPAGVKFHHVKVVVAKKFSNGSGFAVYKRVRCGQTKNISF